MTYPAYSEYKDSGVELLGNIPERWSIRRLKYLTNEPLAYGANEAALDEDKNWPRFVRITDVRQDGTLRPETFKSLAPEIAKPYMLKQGDVLFARSGGTVGKSFIYNSEWGAACFAGYLIRFRSNQSLVLSDFINYFSQSVPYWQQVRMGTIQATIQNFSAEKYGGLVTSLPPLNEQKLITTFLDDETKNINCLIEKQQQLLKLLQEKRQAVISHAVTKGLNNDAKMKDSGVDWLGDIPEHWETRRIKNLFEIRKRISGELGHDVLSITQQGVRIKDIESGEGQLSMDYSKYQIVKTGDFAMNHMDLLTGWVDISKYDGVTSPDYRVFSLTDNKSYADYYLYVLQMGYNEKIFYAFGQGSSHLGRWRFPAENFKTFIFPYPPQEEQIAISNYIKSEHDKIARLIEKCSDAIELLNERRTALISAAVTGKIDVRNAA